MAKYLLIPLNHEATVHALPYFGDLLRERQLIVPLITVGIVIFLAAEGSDTLILVF